jgi:allantoate deiminase
VAPGASNVIPGAVRATLDLRHADAVVRARAVEAILARAVEIAGRRGVEIAWTPVAGYEATPCDAGLMALLADAIAAEGLRVLEVPSGAGHDAISLARIAPVAMLFVRCEGGVSHNPAEAVAVDDVAVAIRVLGGALDRVAGRAAD